jgi:hypothetical protein
MLSSQIFVFSEASVGIEHIQYHPSLPFLTPPSASQPRRTFLIICFYPLRGRWELRLCANIWYRWRRPQNDIHDPSRCVPIGLVGWATTMRELASNNLSILIRPHCDLLRSSVATLYPGLTMPSSFVLA